VGFFATFWSWLNVQLATYIGDNTARLSQVLEPAIVAGATLYVSVWGYLHLTGKIEEPFITGLRRILVLVIVLGVALRLWLYNAVIVDTFYSAPAQLVAAIVGVSDPVATVDAIWDSGGSVASQLWSKGGVFGGEIGFYIAGLAVWILMGLLCVYTMFLIALSSVASSVLLALGPLFVVMLLFDGSRRFFEAWISQLVNYALVTILTVLVAALLLQVVNSYAAQTAARGSAILTVDALDMVLMAVLAFLLLRQIMPIAAGLAGGPALTSFALLSRTVGRAVTGGAALASRGGALAATVAGRGGEAVASGDASSMPPHRLLRPRIGETGPGGAA